jgi:hypothetical protein
MDLLLFYQFCYMLKKQLLASAVLIGFCLSPSLLFAANDQVEARKFKKDSEKTLSAMNTSLQTAITKLPKDSQTVYREIAKTLITEARNSASYSYGASSRQGDVDFLALVKARLESLKKEIQENPVKKSVTSQEKSAIESVILGYQKGFIEPLNAVILPKLIQGLKQKGNTTIHVETKLGYVDITLKNLLYKGNQSTGNFDLSTDIGVQVDMSIPPQKDCDYNEDYEYICTESKVGTGKLTFAVSIPVRVIKQDTALYFSAGEIQSILTSIPPSKDPEVNSSKEITDAIKKFNSQYAGKTYKMTVPHDIEFSQDTAKKQVAFLKLLVSTSVLTPVYANTDSYILDWNPIFTKEYQKIFSSKYKLTSILNENVRYNSIR